MQLQVDDRLKRQADLVICAVLFTIFTASGMLHEGYSTDDWMQIRGPDPEWITHYDRWATYLLSAAFFRGHYLPNVQIAAVFLCLFYVARTVARHVTDAHRTVATIAIFLLGSTHFYMTEMLSFASHGMGYSLAMAASVAAFDLLSPDRAKQGWPVALRALIAAELLSLALGLYQTMALAGGIVALLALIRGDRHDQPSVMRYFLMCLGASALAVILFLAQKWACQSWTGIWATPDGRTGVAYHLSPRAFLAGLPHRLIDLHSSNASGGFPALPKWGNRLFFGLLIAAIGFVALELAARGRLAFALRLLVGTGLALFVVPVCFLLIPDAYVAGRAFAYIGIYYAALGLVAHDIHRTLSAERRGGWFGAGLAGLITAMVVFQGLISQAVLDDRARIDMRDKALAVALVSRVSALPGYRGEPFRIYGRKTYDDTFWGGALGLSVFVGDWSDYSIFRELFGYASAPIGIKAPPHACPAFPAEASVFLYQGKAYACLEASG